MIVYQITTAITVSCWMLSRIDNEFHGNLRNFKHSYILYNWDLHRKHIGFYEDEAEPNMQASYIKIMENIFVSSLWKASTFDSSTRMVVILLVYIKWFLYHELFMIILKLSKKLLHILAFVKGSIVTLWTRHLVLNHIVVNLLFIVSGRKIFGAVTRCNTGIPKEK